MEHWAETGGTLVDKKAKQKNGKQKRNFLTTKKDRKVLKHNREKCKCSHGLLRLTILLAGSGGLLLLPELVHSLSLLLQLWEVLAAYLLCAQTAFLRGQLQKHSQSIQHLNVCKPFLSFSINLGWWIRTVFLAAAGFFFRREEISGKIKGQWSSITCRFKSLKIRRFQAWRKHTNLGLLLEKHSAFPHSAPPLD